MTRDPKLYLKDILTSAKYILEFVQGYDLDRFDRDEKTISAVIRKFEIIGEATKQVPEEIKKNYPDIPWKTMAGMRDVLIHGYFTVDTSIVWSTIHSNIPKVIAQVEQILTDLSQP